jgi:hypothetical protein
MHRLVCIGVNRAGSYLRHYLAVAKALVLLAAVLFLALPVQATIKLVQHGSTDNGDTSTSSAMGLVLGADLR